MARGVMERDLMSPAKRKMADEPTAATTAAAPPESVAVTAVEEQATGQQPTAVPATAAAGPDLYEPYPGANFFHGGRNSPIFRAMGFRLIAEGCGQYPQDPGADWTNTHRRSFAAWQHKLRPDDTDASGIPDQQAWEQLRVPRVSPR